MTEGRGVLIVEDDRTVGAALRAMLERSGWAVLYAESADEGWTIFDRQQTTIQAVIIDVVLPIGNGADLARRFLETRPGLPCLLISGYPLHDLYVRALLEEPLFALNHVRFMQKPFTIGDLLDSLEALLEGSLRRSQTAARTMQA